MPSLSSLILTLRVSPLLRATNVHWVLSLLSVATFASAALPQPDADNGGIILPPGFHARVVADNLMLDRKAGSTQERLRGLVVAENGDIYAKLVRGNVLVLRDTTGDGKMDEIKEFGPGDGGTHIQFHNGYLYHSSRTAVYRYKYIAGESVPSSPVEVIVEGLPAEKDHDAKAFAFDESGHMIVEVGSPYNVFSDGDRREGAKGKTDPEVAEFQKKYGGFWRFDAQKQHQTQADGARFSTGHRHSLALQWHPTSKTFFMVQMGRDNLNIVDPTHYDALDNAERVSEVMHRLTEGANFGWPYSYWDPIKKAHMLAPEYGGDNSKRIDPDPYDKPVIAFPGHWAPMQLALATGTQFPAKYRGGMFVSFHGSWNRAPRAQAGYRIVYVPFNAEGEPVGTYETFADGFSGLAEITNPRDARWRPCGLAVGPDGSLYIGDTDKGRIWRVFYTGDTTTGISSASLASSTTTSAVAPGSESPGGKIFQQLCAACHMADGRGIPGMQPSLIGSSIVAGDHTRLINVLLKGPAAVLPADRERFAIVMPPLASMSDADLAAVISYVRAQFGKSATAVTADQVAAERSKS